MIYFSCGFFRGALNAHTHEVVQFELQLFDFDFEWLPARTCRSLEPSDAYACAGIPIATPLVNLAFF